MTIGGFTINFEALAAAIAAGSVFITTLVSAVLQIRSMFTQKQQSKQIDDLHTEIIKRNGQ